MTYSFKFIEYPDLGRKVLFLYDGLEDEHRKAIQEYDFDKLVLEADDEVFSYLGEFSEKITDLSIGNPCDWMAISKLANLKHLSIGGWYPVDIDFSGLPMLESLDCYWHKGLDDALLNLSELKSLKIEGVKRPDLKFLEHMKKLSFLDIVTSRSLATISGIEGASNLKALHLYSCSKLIDITALKELPSLEELSIEACKKVDVSQIQKLESLQHLMLSSLTLETISFVKDMELKKFSFTDCKVVDGDIRVLCDHPTIEGGLFKDRRHYNLKMSEFKAFCERRKNS